MGRPADQWVGECVCVCLCVCVRVFSRGYVSTHVCTFVCVCGINEPLDQMLAGVPRGGGMKRGRKGEVGRGRDGEKEGCRGSVWLAK